MAISHGYLNPLPQLRGCRGAVIVLMTGVEFGEIEAATLVLGYDEAFSNITFRDENGNNPIMTFVETPLLLSCDIYK